MKYIPYIIITGLFLYILFTPRKQIEQPEPEPIYIDSIRVDTVMIRDTVYVPKWSTRTETKYDTIIDTVYQLRDYNTKYFYSDVILNDFRGFCRIDDTIYQNRIKSRKIKLKIYPRTIYRTKLMQPDKRNVLMYSLGVSGWSDKFGFEAGLAVQTKSGIVYSISYDPINKMAFVRFYKSFIRKM